MRIAVFLTMAFRCTAYTLRSMGELAHPGSNYRKALTELRKLSAPHDAAQYLIDNNFYASALVGTVAETKERNDRLARFCKANEIILYANPDTPGRQLGIGLQPQVNYGDLSEAVVANSESLTSRQLQEALVKVDKEVTCGAWLYSPFMPRHSSKREGIAGHVDAFFEPTDGSPRWALTSLINPALSRSEVVLKRMKGAGFKSFDHTPPSTLLEKLYADTPPNQLVGNWNNVIATEIESEEGRDLTFARLAAAQAGKSDEVVYETLMIAKVWLPVQEYRTACLIRELQETSKGQNGGHPLTIGTHCGINSCGQLTGALFDPGQRHACENLMDIYKRTISASTEIWLVRGSSIEPFDFILKGERDAFFKGTRPAARALFDSFLEYPTLNVPRSQDRASYLENYGSCTEPHPDPDAREFYNEAADIALKLLEEKTE